MFELVNGTKRLVSALENHTATHTELEQLARLLHYMPDQLAEDIKALKEYTKGKENND